MLLHMEHFVTETLLLCDTIRFFALFLLKGLKSKQKIRHRGGVESGALGMNVEMRE